MARKNVNRKKGGKKQQLRQMQAQRARQKRYFILAGAVIIAVIGAAFLIFGDARQVGSYETITKQDWPEADGKALGPADAPVVVKLFSDYQCPYCRLFAEGVEGQIYEDYVKTGQVRFEYHHFIVIDQNVGGNESRRAAEASECASQQGDFWNYHDMLYTNQQGEGTGAFSDLRLKEFASVLGYDMQQFNSCFNSSAAADAVVQDEAQADSYQLSATPSLLVNDIQVQNPLDYNVVKAAIDAALSQAQ
jgi:protein-disulfide isomerase